MKKFKCFGMMVLWLPTLLFAQTGKVFDNLTLTSKILKMDRKYAIYQPAGYETSNSSYPVLYLLHGSGDDQTGWVQFGEVNQIADKAISEGTATAMIIVMPDANTGKRGYMYKKTNPVLTEEQVAAWYKQNNGFELVNNLPENQTKAVRWYIDCGDDDTRSESNSKLHALMNRKGIPHVFRIRDGAHTWTYWRTALPEVLSFISQSFHQY